MKYLLMFVFLIGSVSAHAVTDAHRNAAEELLQITGLKESLNRTAEQLVDFQIRQNPQMAPYRAVFLEFFTGTVAEPVCGVKTILSRSTWKSSVRMS